MGGPTLSTVRWQYVHVFAAETVPSGTFLDRHADYPVPRFERRIELGRRPRQSRGDGMREISGDGRHNVKWFGSQALGLVCSSAFGICAFCDKRHPRHAVESYRCGFQQHRPRALGMR